MRDLAVLSRGTHLNSSRSDGLHSLRMEFLEGSFDRLMGDLLREVVDGDRWHGGADDVAVQVLLLHNMSDVRRISLFDGMTRKTWLELQLPHFCFLAQLLQSIFSDSIREASQKNGRRARGGSQSQ